MRRLNIACGIAHKPEIIIFDEPTVAVDPQSRNNILEGIKKLNEEDSTIIYTSHYMEEVEILCDYIIILDKGKVIAKGTSDQLKNMIEINEKVNFESSNLNQDLINKIKNLPNLIDFSYKGNNCTLTFSHGNENLINLIKLLSENNLVYDNLFSQKPTLNDVFLELTRKDLRD